MQAAEKVEFSAAAPKEAAEKLDFARAFVWRSGLPLR
jgi:hypothetical protein